MARSFRSAPPVSLEAAKRSIGADRAGGAGRPGSSSGRARSTTAHGQAALLNLRDALDWRTTLPALGIVLVTAIAFGGGGVRYGLANLVVQLAALTICTIYGGSFFAFWKRAPFSLKALVAASLALPALQAIPLPPDLWSSLPGRSFAVEARGIVGGLGWATFSLDTARTLVALSGLIVPLVILTLGWALPRERLAWLGWLIVALGCLNVLIGVPQVLSDARLTSFYPETPMQGVLFGTFANRNSTGIFLVAALAFAALLPAARPGRGMLMARLVACAILLVGVFLTQSRTALVLAVIPLGLGMLRAIGAQLRGGEAGSGGRGGAIAVVALCAAGVLAVGALGMSAPGRLGDTLDRFQSGSDPRAYIWEDSVAATERYWPLGAGMGTFDEVFQIDEALENLTQRRAGRAHNDYLEVAIEAGLPGLTLIAAWLILLGGMAIRAAPSSMRWTAWSGAAVLLAIALQSITDYPLRNQSMLAVGSLALLLLVRGGEPSRTKRRSASAEDSA
ncbi:MAG: O-antigen ligase family protein [Pseudomonadota bacterium]